MNQKKKYQIQQGLYISSMNNRWLYQRGVDNGYIILEINNREVNKLKEVRNLKVNDIESILFLKPSGEKERISLRY